ELEPLAFVRGEDVVLELHHVRGVGREIADESRKAGDHGQSLELAGNGGLSFHARGSKHEEQPDKQGRERGEGKQDPTTTAGHEVPPGISLCLTRPAAAANARAFRGCGPAATDRHGEAPRPFRGLSARSAGPKAADSARKPAARGYGSPSWPARGRPCRRGPGRR